MPILSNAKHEAVALAYIADSERIGWRAYKGIYAASSQRAAETAWSRLLNNAEFSARVAELAEQAAQGAVMSAQEVLQELSKIGRSNMADYVRAFACMDPVEAVEKLTPDQNAALGEVTVEDFMEGRGEDAREVRRIKFKLIAKTPALELLGKHHRLYIDRVEHDVAGSLADRLAAAIARVGTSDGESREEKRPDRRPPRGGNARKAPRKGKRARAR